MKIQRHEIAKGIFWIEVPSIDLGILCGTPADAIKHLKKTGRVRSTSKNGVDFQTGPDAILLSDLPIQGGEFANYSEFPVLQMLYLKGMILPNHPGNTGAKPLLIGSPDQISSQMEYIKRGNYGLYSMEELAEFDFTKEKQKELMAIKLAFAFGQIKESKDLVGSLWVGNEYKEIRDGLFIKRNAINVFSFKFEDCEEIVDLNLGPTETYQSPIHHDYTYSKEGFFKIIHSGNGDGWDTDRQAMNSVIGLGGKHYLIDCGPNMKSTLEGIGLSCDDIEGVFLTHCHDDHIAGLTTLFKAKKRINLYATAEVRMSISKKLSALLSMEFDTLVNFFNIHDIEVDSWHSVGLMDVCAKYSPHPVECTTFIFRAMCEGGYKTYLHLADITSDVKLEEMFKQGCIKRETLDQVYKSYRQPADVKKIDAGGLPIHGIAEDFVNDKSKKLIISHMSRDISKSEESIGVSVGFGSTDVLIEGSEYPRHLEIIEKSFAKRYRSVDKDLFSQFKYCEIVTYNPGDHVLEETHSSNSAYVIIRGIITRIDTETEEERQMTMGSIFGDKALVLGESDYIYKSLSDTKLLKIPSEIYRKFLLKNDLDEHLTLRINEFERWEKISIFNGICFTDYFDEIIVEAFGFDLGKVGDVKQFLTEESGVVDHLLISEDFTEWEVFDGNSDGTTLNGRVKAVQMEIIRKYPVVYWNIFQILANEKVRMKFKDQEDSIQSTQKKTA